MDKDIDSIIEKTADELRKGFSPKCIYLFGSRVRGDENEHSDADFMVVVDESSLTRHRRAQLARGFVTDKTLPKDIMVFTATEWDRGLCSKASLPSCVVREGILLYER